MDKRKKQELSRLGALLVCSQDGKTEKVSWLIQQGIDVNARDLGVTALSISSQNGRYECVDMLLEAGADVNVKDLEKNTPLIAAAQGGHRRCINRLISGGAQVNDVNEKGYSALMYSLAAKDQGCVSDLISAGALVNQRTGKGVTPLHVFSLCGHHESIQCLLQAGADVNAVDAGGKTPLMCASKNGNFLGVSCLLQAGSNIKQKDKCGITSFLFASIGGHKEIMALLLQAGASIYDEGATGNQALCYSSLYGHTDCVLLLLKLGAEVNARNEDGVTAVMCAASNGHDDIIHELIKAGALVNEADKNGMTALMCAADEGHEKCIEALVYAGAEIEKEDSDGLTAASYATKNGHNDALKLLIRKGTQVNKETGSGETLLTIACSNGNQDCLLTLLEAGACVNKEDSNGWSPLSMAALYGCHTMLETLFQFGAREDRENELTPLMIACHSGRTKCVQVLIQHSEVEETSSNEEAALSLACEQNHWECVLLLIQAGASLVSTLIVDPQVGIDSDEVDDQLTSPMGYHFLNKNVKGAERRIANLKHEVNDRLSGDRGLLYMALKQRQGATGEEVKASKKLVRLLLTHPHFNINSAENTALGESDVCMALQDCGNMELVQWTVRTLHKYCIEQCYEERFISRMRQRKISDDESDTNEVYEETKEEIPCQGESGKDEEAALLPKHMGISYAEIEWIDENFRENESKLQIEGSERSRNTEEKKCSDPETECIKGKDVKESLMVQVSKPQTKEIGCSAAGTECIGEKNVKEGLKVQVLKPQAKEMGCSAAGTECIGEKKIKEGLKVQVLKPQTKEMGFSAAGTECIGEKNAKERLEAQVCKPQTTEDKKQRKIYLGTLATEGRTSTNTKDIACSKGNTEKGNLEVGKETTLIFTCKTEENKESTEATSETPENSNFVENFRKASNLKGEEDVLDEEKAFAKTVLETEKDLHKYMRNFFESQWKTRITTCTRNIMGRNNTSVKILKGLDQTYDFCSCFSSITRCWQKVNKMTLVLMFRFSILLTLVYYFDLLTDSIAAQEITATENVPMQFVVASWVVAWLPHIILSVALFRQRKRILFEHMDNQTKTYAIVKYPLLRFVLLSNLNSKILFAVFFVFQLWPLYMYLIVGVMVWDLRNLGKRGRKKIRTAIKKIKQELVIVSEVNTAVEASAQLFLSLWVVLGRGDQLGWLLIMKMVTTPVSVGFALLQLEGQLEYPVELGFLSSITYFISATFRYISRFSTMLLFSLCFSTEIIYPIAANILLIFIIRCVEVKFLKKGSSLRKQIMTVVWSRKPWMSFFSYQPDILYDYRMPRGSRFLFVFGATFIDLVLTLIVSFSCHANVSYIWWLLISIWCCHLLSIATYVVYLRYAHPWKYWIKW